jgi:hypothetical protein
VNFVITADPNAGILSGNQACGLTTTSTTTGELIHQVRLE